jgi:hypothetical protein
VNRRMCLVAEETSKTHMNALPGVDWRIAFSLAPTGLTRFFGITQAKAWAMLSWPFGP